jgi:hypothetical protein
LSESLKSKLLAAILLLLPIVNPTVATGGELDPRFDGKWVGVETMMYNDGHFTLAGKAPQMNTMVAIANSGQLFGIVEGFAPGRYLISDKSQGNRIIVESSQRSCKFVLSADGNTVKEDGNIFLHRIRYQVWATFHRIGK